MADDVLTHEELETLLTATPSVPPPKRSSAPRPAEPRRVTSAQAISKPQVKRIHVVDDDRVRMLRAVHEQLASGIAAALATKLRCRVDAKLTSVDQPRYGELARGLDNPTCLGVLQAPPLVGELAIDVQHTVLLPILERLLGGGREPSPAVRRTLTAIEQRLAARVLAMFADELQQAWHGVADAAFAVVRVEQDPQATRIAAPDEAVVRARLELTVGEARGFVTVCFPGGVLRSIEPKSSSREAASGTARSASSDVPDAPPIELVAQLASTRVATQDLETLQVGDIIATDGEVHGPLVVSIDGVPRFHARGGVVDGRKAVRIDRSDVMSSDDSRQ